MSSDYLNYELSKQLHDLGAEFEDRGTWVEPGNFFFDGKYSSDAVYSPTTAQLIDAFLNKVRVHKAGSEYHILHAPDDINFILIAADKCCTTALGLALIELAKGGEE